MKLVVLLVGALVVVLAVILDTVNERNDWLGAGLLLFSLTASTYFLAWPVSRDDEGTGASIRSLSGFRFI